MAEELTFDKEGSKFVIKQNIPLDTLIEGEPIEREYEVILYNAVVPIYKFPELEFDSWIRNPTLSIVRLMPEFPKRDSRTKDLLEALIGGGGGALIGSFLGDRPGAVIGAVLGGLAAKEVPKAHDWALREWQKIYGTKKVEIIKGANLRSNSAGIVPIDDKITLFFGIYHYTNRFTTPEDRELNVKAINQIKELIESERKAVQSQINILFIKNKSKEINEESSYFMEFKELSDLLGLFRDFRSVFGEDQNLIYLHNKIEIDSDYRKATKSKFVKSDAEIGDIGIKTRRGCSMPKEGITEQVRRALYKRTFFLENILTVDLEEIINRKKEEIARKFATVTEGIDYLKEDFPIPFYVLDKKEGIRLYGVLNINTQNLNITGGRYFNNKERTIYQI